MSGSGPIRAPKWMDPQATLSMKFHLRFEAGNEFQPPDQAVIDEINTLLEGVQEGFELKK